MVRYLILTSSIFWSSNPFLMLNQNLKHFLDLIPDLAFSSVWKYRIWFLNIALWRLPYLPNRTRPARLEDCIKDKQTKGATKVSTKPNSAIEKQNKWFNALSQRCSSYLCDEYKMKLHISMIGSANLFARKKDAAGLKLLWVRKATRGRLTTCTQRTQMGLMKMTPALNNIQWRCEWSHLDELLK